MDFVTAWKASSIVLTGAFGILGLVKDFKDKKTNKVTMWGYISLCGILVSTAFGVIAQLKESSDADRAKQATARQTLELAQKTDQTLQNIQRTLAPLDGVRIDLSFKIDCKSQEFLEFCRKARHHLEKERFWTYGRGIARIFDHVLEVRIFQNNDSAATFLKEGDPVGDSLGNIVFLFPDQRQSNPEDVQQLKYQTNPEGATLSTFNASVQTVKSDGKIISLPDLQKCVLLLSGDHKELSGATPKSFHLRTKSGQGVTISQFERIHSPEMNELDIYRSVIP